jgi:hypothetical protein
MAVLFKTLCGSNPKNRASGSALVTIAPAPKGNDGAGWKNGTPAWPHIALGYQKGASLVEPANPPFLLPLLIKIGRNVTG